MAMTPRTGEAAMNVQYELNEVIDLGAASVETKGNPIGMDDSQGGRNPFPGLSDE
jgi:hypothetical protein